MAHSREATETTLPEIKVVGRKSTPARLGDSALGGSNIPASFTNDTAKLLDKPGVAYGAGGVSAGDTWHGGRPRARQGGRHGSISACGNHMVPALSYIDHPASAASTYLPTSRRSRRRRQHRRHNQVDSAKPEFAAAGKLAQGTDRRFCRSNGEAKAATLRQRLQAGDEHDI